MRTFFRRKISFALLIVEITLLLCLASPIVLAQNENEEDEQGLTISPIVFELNSDPGDTLENQIKIYNPTVNPINVKMIIEDFTPVGEEGQVILETPDEDSTYSLANWTSISPSEFDLGAKEQRIVTFIINVPPNGEPGGHYGSIVAMLSGGSIQMTGTAIGSKRGALILLRVSGNIIEDLIVDTFSADSFQEYGPVDFDLKFENTGNVHVRPAGFINITDIWGKEVATLSIPQHNVIPGALRQAGATWEEKNLIGRYTATLVANYGGGEKQTITAVTTFTVFPWKKAMAVGVLLLVLLFISIRGRERIARAVKVLLGKH